MIEFSNVSKIYQNGTEALHNISLNVEKGEFVFIVGSSGAGKSTFLKLVMCEERPTSGKIIIDGQDVSRIRKRKIPYVRRKMGIVFQDFRLIDHMTVYDNVAFAMRVVGASAKTIKKRVPYILGLVGLQHKAKHFPTELSGGEQQRIGLARALVNNPSIIVADEPTGNIDPALSFEIVDLLNEINRRGTTILLVTHEHSLVKHFHKRIIQIHSGEIVADTAELRSSPSEEESAPLQDSETEDGVPDPTDADFSAESQESLEEAQADEAHEYVDDENSEQTGDHADHDVNIDKKQEEIDRNDFDQYDDLDDEISYVEVSSPAQDDSIEDEQSDFSGEREQLDEAEVGDEEEIDL